MKPSNQQIMDMVNTIRPMLTGFEPGAKVTVVADLLASVLAEIPEKKRSMMLQAVVQIVYKLLPVWLKTNEADPPPKRRYFH